MKPKGHAYFFAAVTGLLLLIAFYFLPFFAFFAFIPLILVCRQQSSKRSFALGFTAGFVFSAGLLYWVLALEIPGKGWLYAGVFLLFLYYGLCFGIFTFLANFLEKRYGELYLFLIPFIWTTVEFIRSLSAELGFPWGSLAYALTPYPSLVQFLSYTGVAGVTFFIIVVNVLLYYIIVKKKPILFVAIIAIFALDYAWGRRFMKITYPSNLKVAVIQSNIAPEVKLEGNPKYRFALLDSLSRTATNCDLIVWPETAIPGYMGLRTDKEKTVAEIVDSIGVAVIAGAARVDFDESPPALHNSAYLFGPDTGIVDFYDKIYLVPFGERLPFEDVFPALRRLHFGQGDFSHGKEFKVFSIPEGKFSPLICFESIFPRLVRRFVHNGAQFLVNITEDSWFGRTAGPYQHSGMAIFRAIEYRMPLVRCGNSGVSFFVFPNGRVEQETQIFTRRVIISDIPLRQEETFYARQGDVFAWVCVILMVLPLSVAIFRRKKSLQT
jgi:apolipoprotein N-acyltransferase